MSDAPIVDNPETGRFEIEQILEDIESLNRRAVGGELEVSAVSIHAYAHLTDLYALMPCGASMGDGYGPCVVARAPIGLDLGAATPEETAISICAEIIALRSGRQAPSLRNTTGDIHS